MSTLSIFVLFSLNTIITYVIGMGCKNGDVELVGYNSAQGRVQLCRSGGWSTVCNRLWDTNDARVVCRQLGHDDKGVVTLADQFLEFGKGSGTVYYDQIGCNGTESKLTDCPSVSVDHSSCKGHFNDAGVKCLPQSYASTFKCTSEGAIRLMGGRKPFAGRVEVCVNGYWSAICGANGWDDNDARVVCKQLGYTGGTGNIKSQSDSLFGISSGNIVYDNMRCQGSEQRLVDCDRDETLPVNCGGGFLVGVICDEPANCVSGSVRISDEKVDIYSGANSKNNGTRGTVEICQNGAWGTICDEGWDNNDAKVVCRELGLNGGTAISGAKYGTGKGSVVQSRASCTGSENSLSSCAFLGLSGSSCSSNDHSKDAGVECYADACVTGDVRLVNGLTKYEGRVEYCKDGVWGTIYDDLWSPADAIVVCRQLEYRGGVSLKRSYFGDGFGGSKVALKNVQCSGTEKRLADCTKLTAQTEVHNNDASVVCLPPPPCDCKERAQWTVCRYMKDKGTTKLPAACQNTDNN